MSLKEKLSKVQKNSTFDTLSDKNLYEVFGGGSCTYTASSSACERTAVCNCPKTDKLEPIEP